MCNDCSRNRGATALCERSNDARIEARSVQRGFRRLFEGIRGVSRRGEPVRDDERSRPIVGTKNHANGHLGGFKQSRRSADRGRKRRSPAAWKRTHASRIRIRRRFDRFIDRRGRYAESIRRFLIQSIRPGIDAFNRRVLGDLRRVRVAAAAYRPAIHPARAAVRVARADLGGETASREPLGDTQENGEDREIAERATHGGLKRIGRLIKKYERDRFVKSGRIESLDQIDLRSSSTRRETESRGVKRMTFVSSCAVFRKPGGELSDEWW